MVRFDRNHPFDFKTLRKEINQFVLKDDYSKKYLLYKFFAFALLFPVVLTLLYFAQNAIQIIALYIALGVVIVFGAMNFGHDGVHKSLSKRSIINKIGSYWYILVGLSPYCWRLTHNVIHHNNSNIIDHDHDIMGAGLIDFTGEGKKTFFIKYQYIFAPILYSLVTIHWLLYKDIKFLTLKNIVNFNIPKTLPKIYVEVVFQKIIHFLILLVIPLLLTKSLAVIAGFLLMHVMMGLVFSHLALVAHINLKVQMLENDDYPNQESDWYTHQLLTTANFRVKNSVIRNLLGGLPFQVEHHLFPHLNHYQLDAINELVKNKITSIGKPYIEFTSFGAAVKSHYALLYINSK